MKAICSKCLRPSPENVHTRALLASARHHPHNTSGMGIPYGKRAKMLRSRRLDIRLTEQELLNLHAIAEKCGKTVSDLVRDTVLQVTRVPRTVSRLNPARQRFLRLWNAPGIETDLNSNGDGKTARVNVPETVVSARGDAIARKTGHARACKCVECENLRSLFRLADGRPQAKQPKRRNPIPQ